MPAFLLAALAGLAAWLWTRRSAQGGVSAPSIPYEPWRELYEAVTPFSPPPSAAPYLPMLQAAEIANGIPAGLLVRLAYQESRFRPDIISGDTVSSAGAVGIMQIVPRWHPGVDPRNPAAAIPYAAHYLAEMYRQFGTWPLALAAYNWGPGNVRKWIAGQASPPAETRLYVAQIIADVPTIA